MASEPPRDNAAASNGDRGGKPPRQRVIEAFLALLADKPIERVAFGEIAAGANLSLSELRDLFGSTLAILAAYMKEVDRAVLASDRADMAGEPPRERLFDVLMRRIEVLTPHKAAVRSLMRSALRNGGLALALNGLAVRSQQWMLTAADISASGSKGAVRAQGMALLFASVLRTWVDDDDPGLAKTMAALDRALARGERWSGWLDDLLRATACRGGRGRRSSRQRRSDEAGDETISA
jgi:AcrR family transcriptional regulator